MSAAGGPAPGPALGLAPCEVPTMLSHCRAETTLSNFFSSVDGQLELLAQAVLDQSASSAGALQALRPRLRRFHELLLEPPEVHGWREVT